MTQHPQRQREQSRAQSSNPWHNIAISVSDLERNHRTHDTSSLASAWAILSAIIDLECIESAQAWVFAINLISGASAIVSSRPKYIAHRCWVNMLLHHHLSSASALLTIPKRIACHNKSIPHITQICHEFYSAIILFCWSRQIIACIVFVSSWS